MIYTKLFMVTVKFVTVNARNLHFILSAGIISGIQTRHRLFYYVYMCNHVMVNIERVVNIEFRHLLNIEFSA